MHEAFLCYKRIPPELLIDKFKSQNVFESFAMKDDLY
jgi:hypothetical protein